jgi:RNase P subunit RPR2
MASGYNNGRHYYLSAESVAGRDALLELLQRNTKVARKRAEAETFFQKVQLKVRRRYESKAAQYFLAGLIISVRISHMKQKYVNNICICQYQSRYPCIELQAYYFFVLAGRTLQNFALTVFEVQFVNELSNPDGSPTEIQRILDWVSLSGASDI